MSYGFPSKGTTTNDNAATGYPGEYISSSVPAASTVSLASATPISITNVTLTAGDWDVSGIVDYVTAGATTSDFKSGTNATTAFGVADTFANMPLIGTALSDTFGHIVPPTRYSLASTSPVYLMGQANFSVGTSTGYGTIRARRAR